MFKFVQIFRTWNKILFVFQRIIVVKEIVYLYVSGKILKIFFVACLLTIFFFLQHIWKRIRSSINGGKFFFLFEKYELRTIQVGGWLGYIRLLAWFQTVTLSHKRRRGRAIVPSNGNTRYKVSPRNSSARIIVVLGPLSPPTITFPSI